MSLPEQPHQRALALFLSDHPELRETLEPDSLYRAGKRCIESRFVVVEKSFGTEILSGDNAWIGVINF